jgi:hypothetical protein
MQVAFKTFYLIEKKLTFIHIEFNSAMLLIHPGCRLLLKPSTTVKQMAVGKILD